MNDRRFYLCHKITSRPKPTMENIDADSYIYNYLSSPVS